ncbi:MAG: glycerophosphodiester phosphodiesterase family protein [Clostridia bacterium]|nr:glycerophosphodiester phosphodiesterase family protein [Clostridia bacterium]
MMKTNRRTFSIFIPALTLILLTLLSACGEQTEPPAPPADSTAVPEPVPNCIIVGGEQTYQIIRAERGDTVEIEAAQALQNGIRTVSGASLTLTDDWYRTEEEIPPYEILVGEVNRAETREAMAELHYHDFTVRMTGNKLVVLGANPAGTSRAVNYLLENFVTEAGLSLPADFCYMDRGAYSADSISIGGVPISEYSIAYEKKGNLEHAQLLHRILGEYCGVNLPVVEVKANEAGENLLVIGNGTHNTTEFYAYFVLRQGSCIYFDAYDRYAYGNAFLAVVDKLKANGGQVELSALNFSYILPDREAYLEDPSLLYMRWAAEWETPEWMLDYELKKKELFGGSGTRDVWVNAHRADHTYYPENSLESIISCYYMGVSIVELDLAITRDGVIVLMHDETLTRMTDVADYLGKPGYPNSANVSAWTYAQLQELYLKDNQGGASAPLTKFKIPTLEEALTVCRGRLFIVPDKPSLWQYIDTTAVMKDSDPNFLFPLMQKTGNYASILVSYGKPNGAFLSVTQAAEIQSALHKASGVTPFILLRCSPSASVSNYNILSKRAPGTFAFQLHGNYDPKTNYTEGTRPNLDKCTFAAWTIGTGDADNDFAENWRKLADDGVRLIMTNDPMGMVRFAAEYHNP